MDDLRDYVTNNMRGILKSEEKRNVLYREKGKKKTMSSTSRKSPDSSKVPVLGNNLLDYLDVI